LTPEQITPNSSNRVWWKCDSGHEWKLSVRNRIKGSSSDCPFCTGKIATKDNNLSVKHPELLKEWNDEKNISINPLKLLAGDKLKAWWQCPNGHEWQASIYSRTKEKTGCPCCAGKKVAPNKNLAIYFPELAAQWNYERNSGKKPEEFSPKSGKKVWWKCPQGHEWEAVVANRSNGNGCPICAGRKIEVAQVP
jgi:hypothetical protein